MGEMSKRRGPGLVEKPRDIVIQGCMIVLQRQDRIGPLLRNDLGDFLLTPHGINRHRGPGQVQHL